MKLRSAFTSAPAVAGMAVLAVAVGAVLGVRAGMDDGGHDRTEVAGAVIERSEAPVQTEEPTPRVNRVVVVRPAPPTQPPPATDPAPAAEQPVAEPTPTPAQPVGLVRDDPAPVAEPAPRPRRDRTPPQETSPEPTRSPRPTPSPSPTQDPAVFALQPGSVDGTDHAMANDDGGWDVKRISGHTQTPKMQRSREARHRLTAKFNDTAVNSTRDERTFRCDVVIDAGSRRLIVDDDNHEFAISLWTSDGYSPVALVDTVTVRAELDLAAGATRTLRGGAYLLDAADGESYTCRAEYVDLRG